MSNTRKIIIILCLVVIVASACFILFYVTTQNRNNQVYEDLKVMVAAGTSVPSAVPATQEPQEPAHTQGVIENVVPLATQTPYVSEIDFQPLWEVNTDIYAWLEIPDTDVAYPIVQSATDDSYYLDHTIEGVAGYPGSIYTESLNSKDFTDFNTVIYGHNMANRTMFGSLKDFRDEEFFNEHRKILIYTPEKKLTYTIYAAVLYNSNHILKAYDSTTEGGRISFLSSVASVRNLYTHFAPDVSVSTEDHLVTLSTCVGGQPNNRYLIIGVLEDEDTGE